MLKNIKNIKPLENLFYLSLSQGVNLLIPILIVPYLIKTVGIEKFGIIALTQTICSFFYILTDYGFNITAVKSLSVNRHDKQKVTKIVNEVLGTKLLLTLISFPIFIGVCWFFLKDNASLILILMSFMLVLGQAFLPIWLFQGLEINQYITYVNLVSKTLFITLLFVLVRREQDFILCNFLLGTINFISGITITFLFLKKELKQNFQYVPFQLIKEQLIEGKELFLSGLAVNLYINSNILILSLFTSSYLVGIYSIVEKIIFLLRAILGIFIQAIYSSACQIAHNKGYKEFANFVHKYFIVLIVLLLIVLSTLFFYSELVVSFLSKNSINEISHYVRFLILVPIIVAFNVPANITLLVYNFKSYSARISIMGAFISILLSMLLVPKLLIDGTVWSILLTELFITFSINIIVVILKFRKKII